GVRRRRRPVGPPGAWPQICATGDEAPAVRRRGVATAPAPLCYEPRAAGAHRWGARPGLRPGRRQDAAAASASSMVGSLPRRREARFGPGLLAHGSAPARWHQQVPAGARWDKADSSARSASCGARLVARPGLRGDGARWPVLGQVDDGGIDPPQRRAWRRSGSRNTVRASRPSPVLLRLRPSSRSTSSPAATMTALSPTAPTLPACSSVASAPSTMRSSPRIAPSQSNLGHAAAARGCYSRVGVDLSNICAGILHHLEDRLVPSAAAVDPNVFHLKMEGDYHLYLAERNAAANSTLDANQAAQFHEGAVVHAPHQAGPNMLDRQSDSPTRNAAELLYFHHMKDEAIR
ncbi:unnamed protein product, partial [Urochloa humidicola]